MSGISAPFGVKKVVIKLDLSPAGGVRSRWNWTAVRKCSFKILGALLALVGFPALAYGIGISLSFAAESAQPGDLLWEHEGTIGKLLVGAPVICVIVTLFLIFRNEIMSRFWKKHG